MKRVPAIVAILASGLALSAAAQTPASPAPAVAPKVAVIAFQAAVTSTNEFQREFGDVQKKFLPQREQLKTLSDEVDTLTKQLQTQGSTPRRPRRSTTRRSRRSAFWMTPRTIISRPCRTPLPRLRRRWISFCWPTRSSRDSRW
jgi:Skp family chaperone for outer membrane proteins